MNEFQNQLIIKDEAYENGFFPKIPNYKKHGAAFILAGGSGDDIIVDDSTTAKEIRKGRYTRLIEISTLSYMKEIRFNAPSKENAYSFDVYVKAVIQVVDPIAFYENRNIDVDGYFNNLFSLDVKKITRKYSILNYENMDEELTNKLSAYNTVDRFIGFSYQVSVVSAEVGEKAREYVAKQSKQQLDALSKQKARELVSSYSDSYEEAIRTEVAEGKITESEAILKIQEYNRNRAQETTDYILKLRENDLITGTAARNYTMGGLQLVADKNMSIQQKENMKPEELDISGMKGFYGED